MKTDEPNYPCAGIDGQCAKSWCDCKKYQLSAIKWAGDITKIMQELRCAFTIAKRASEWWHAEISKLDVELPD